MNKIFHIGHGDMGRYIQDTTIKQALLSCNPGFHFDVGGNLDIDHPMIGTRQGVWFNGNHICSMDRGNVPEAKVWQARPGLEEIDWVDIDKFDDAQVCYAEILPTDPIYEEAVLAFEAKRDGYRLDLQGRLFHYRALRRGWEPEFILYVGWQHTLYRVLNRRIPGVTAETVCKALGIAVHQLQFNGKVCYVMPEDTQE